MPEQNDNIARNGPPPFDVDLLLHDLRELPEVAAPMDFSEHLSRKIEKIDNIEGISLWKRFFLPAAEGGFRIPAYAYGAVAALAVVFVSVYVFNITSFEQELHREIDPRPAIKESETRIRQGLDAKGSNGDEAPLERETPPLPLIEESGDAIGQTERKSESGAGTDDALSQGGRAETSAPEAATATESAEPLRENDDQSEFRTRGFLGAEDALSHPDSLLSDSLRRADSLQRSRIDIQSEPEPEAR
ncbi:MAG: hypothetical protein KFH87_12225 [Bacteroidetes bacterium]|nr:hypothetical protein [Bacteroidota bacterium]